ncbi:hypothetical protein WKW80_30405 [Variovorax humicola]|uniref:DGQHR domain-containing protein n=1 Tax=Variovorax humicola TaxID=1769758 RepID=A0ABU8W8B2_9BURK
MMSAITRRSRISHIHWSNILERDYFGTAYRQAQDPGAPWLISFVATAEEVSTWAGIPRRSEKGLVGFQRPDDAARVDRAQEYFKDPVNQSPTALIVGIHRVSSETDRRVRLQFLDGHNDLPTRPCKLTISFDPEPNSLADAVQSIKAQISLRLSETSGADDDSDDEEDDSDSDGEDDDPVGDDGEIELGRSLLMELANKLEDSTWCEANKTDLFDLAKPCTVIDGQHRLKGATRCERNIPFAVIAIYDCSWPEQVFQFTVVNYTAQGIPDQFITQNAALSLTGDELEDLKARLTQAKVKVVEYELMRVVNFDGTSPFYQLVSMASQGNEETKIGYKTMVKIAKAWHNGKHSAIKQIVANLYPDITGKASIVKRERQHRWVDGDWGIFFIDFWDAIRGYYEKEAPPEFKPWKVGASNLMLAATLLELQNVFLFNLTQQDEEFFIPDSQSKETPLEQLRAKIRKRAEKVASLIPVEFFQRTWKMKSLNTGAGRAAIQTALKTFLEKKGNYQYDKSSLITGKTN